tara:strand:+ start:988 stop:1263 length:276 start_codon:yes stop_codon:yes gene_type:complete
MPRYHYKCETCKEVEIYRLPFGKEPAECVVCEATGSFTKVYSKNAFNFVTQAGKDNSNSPAGTITKEYIKQNREILEKQKKEAVKEEYEPS